MLNPSAPTTASAGVSPFIFEAVTFVFFGAHGLFLAKLDDILGKMGEKEL